MGMTTQDAWANANIDVDHGSDGRDDIKPKVKPLAWCERKRVGCKFETISVCGLYKVVEWLDNSGNVLFFGNIGSPIRINAPVGPVGEAALKAAAQDDHARRILSALA